MGLILASVVLASQDPLVGSYTDGALQVTIQGGAGQYSGQITLNQQVYPLQAQGSAQQLIGSFQAGASRFDFQATLQGDTLTLTTGNRTYILRRQATPDHEQLTRVVRPGTRLTYYGGAASHPGYSTNPEARSTAGEGYMQVTILHVEEQLCVMSVADYLLDPLERTLSASGSNIFVSRDGSCGEYWIPPERLQQMPQQNAPELSVSRGPVEHEGHNYNGIYISSDIQQTRNHRLYDLDTGILLNITMGTGEPGGPSANPTSSSYNRLQRVRQLELPWRVNQPLPDHIRNLQRLEYQGSTSVAYPGVPSVEISSQLRLEVQQRNPTWLLLTMTTTTSPSPGMPPTPPSQAQWVLTAASGFFVPPEALRTLQPGQLLDEDPVIGLRMVVERVDASGVVIAQQGATINSSQTFDLQTGLMTTSTLQQQFAGTTQTIRYQLTSHQ